MPIAIREADLADPRQADSVVAVIDGYARDAFGGGKPLPAPVLERLIPGLRAHPTTLVLLALDGNDAVGVAVCFFGFSTFAARPLLNVHDLAVVPAARNRGGGRALLAAAEARARARGCCKLTLEVLDRNEPARALYAHVGFADAGLGESAFTRFLVKPLEDER
jgi:GNAT superfamily N-acetyltransferase